MACSEIAQPRVNVLLTANVCQDSLDCNDGICDRTEGRCVSRSTELDSLLLEVVPRNADRGFGYRFLHRIEGVSQADELEIELERPPTLNGRLNLYFPSPPGPDPTAAPAAPCIPRSVELRLIPQERALGMDVQPYFTTSKWTTDELRNEQYQGYSLSVPPGGYDLYFREAEPYPLDAVWKRPECRSIVPQLARGIEVLDTEDASLNVRSLTQTGDVVRPLQVRVPWNEGLAEWTVDVVNQTTGERLSSTGYLREGVIREDPAVGPVVVVDISLASVVAYSAGSIEPTELVEGPKQTLRLRPSDPTVTPTLLIPLAALETTRGVVTTSPVPALRRVDYRAWVWDEGDSNQPVSGRVEFVAKELRDVTDTQFPVVQFRKSVDIAEDGAIRVELPLGDYDVRVLPDRARFATYQTVIALAEPPKPLSDGARHIQAGHVFDVPIAAELRGHVVLPSRNQEATGIAAQVISARSGGLGYRPAALRSATVLLDGRNFELEGVDCRGCADESHAVFDLRLLPPAGSDLPWFVRPNVDVSSTEVELGEIAISAPFRLRGSLKAKGAVFPGPLIRAFVFLNDLGGLESDLSLPMCVDLAAFELGEQRCLERVVQVSSARADEQGRFELLLPRALDTTAVVVP